MVYRYLFTNSRKHRGRYYEDDIVEMSQMNDYSEDNFETKFKTSKAEIIKICDIVKNEIYTKPCRKMDLSIKKKVLLKLWLREVFEKGSKDFINVSQPTVSNSLQAFTDCLTNKAKQLTYMPKNRTEEKAIKTVQ